MSQNHPPPRHILYNDGVELSQALSQSLRESEVQLVVEDTWPFRERASGQNGRLIFLRFTITTEAGALFDDHPRSKNKALLLDITILNPCPISNLKNVALHTGNHVANAVDQRNNKYRGSFPATYSFLPHVKLTYGEIGSDLHALVKKLTIRQIEHTGRRYTPTSLNISRRGRT